MSMKSMLQLKERLCKELEDLGRKETMSDREIDQIQKLTSSIKNIGKIGTMEAEGMYDEDSPSYRSGRYMGGSYDDGMGGSYRRGRGYRDGSYGDGGYDIDGTWRMRKGSYDDGRSEMADHLESMLSKASSTHEKDVIRRAIEDLRR